jgi:hypothetical protein
MGTPSSLVRAGNDGSMLVVNTVKRARPASARTMARA